MYLDPGSHHLFGKKIRKRDQKKDTHVFEYVSKFILKAWKNKLDNSDITILDSKTKLQEYSLKKFKRLPKYQVINHTGPKHNPVYKISVSIIGSKPFVGSGRSKQDAQQNGATELLKSLNIK